VNSRVFRRLVLACATASVLCGAIPAHAQLSRVGGTIPAIFPGITMRGSDVGYDPANNLFLVVIGHGPIFGVFTNRSGAPVTPVFTIMDGVGTWGHFPRVKYSPDVNDGGGGGLGGFLVTWHQSCGAVNCVFGKLVAYTPTYGPTVQGLQLISDGAQFGSWHETGPAMAYSRTSRRFLVAWRTNQYAIHGRFVDINGIALGSVIQFESGTSRDPALTWNSSTDEFGLIYTGWDGGPHASFRRVRASDGVVSPRTAFGYSSGTFATAIDVNGRSQYLVTWALHPGTMSATLDASGALLTTAFLTSGMGFDQSLGMALHPATDTALVVSSDRYTYEVAGIEINSNGSPNGVPMALTDGARVGSNYPMTTPKPNGTEWNVVYVRDFRMAVEQLISTSSIILPPPTAPTGLTTLCNGCSPTTLPSSTSVTPAVVSLTPAPTGCAIPDPFTSLGGGTCVNGGWLPPGMVPAAPIAAPAPATGCSIPDPFTSIGGGICRNGGWIPRGMAQ
jgi:hypothetical protein